MQQITGRQFNPYSAGRKMYGVGRDFPTIGMVDKSGYRMRDAQARARKNALLRRLNALKQGKIMQPDVLRRLG